MRDPIRVIQGTAKPHEPFWNFRNAAESESGEVELEFFGPISEYAWWGDEVTPAAFKNELNQKGAGKPVTVLVNSSGGEVIAASVIRSILQEYSGAVTADIVGLAASAATIVVTGADRIRMRESALFMIHDPSGLAYGNIDEIKTFLDILKTVKDTIVDTYQTKTGLDRDKLAKLMTDETWMTAREAKELGFIDEVVSGSLKKPSAMNMSAGFINCLSNYMHVPEALNTQISALVQQSNVQSEPPEEERRLRNLAKLLKGA
jgi:ATP-dependent Clp protease protease subunit